MDYQWVHRPMEAASRVIGISVVVTCYWPYGLPHTSGLGMTVHTGKVDVQELGSYSVCSQCLSQLFSVGSAAQIASERSDF